MRNSMPEWKYEKESSPLELYILLQLQVLNLKDYFSFTKKTKLIGPDQKHAVSTTAIY